MVNMEVMRQSAPLCAPFTGDIESNLAQARVGDNRFFVYRLQGEGKERVFIFASGPQAHEVLGDASGQLNNATQRAWEITAVGGLPLAMEIYDLGKTSEAMCAHLMAQFHEKARELWEKHLLDPSEIGLFKEMFSIAIDLADGNVARMRGVVIDRKDPQPHRWVANCVNVFIRHVKRSVSKGS